MLLASGRPAACSNWRSRGHPIRAAILSHQSTLFSPGFTPNRAPVSWTTGHGGRARRPRRAGSASGRTRSPGRRLRHHLVEQCGRGPREVAADDGFGVSGSKSTTTTRNQRSCNGWTRAALKPMGTGSRCGRGRWKGPRRGCGHLEPVSPTLRQYRFSIPHRGRSGERWTRPGPAPRARARPTGRETRARELLFCDDRRFDRDRS